MTELLPPMTVYQAFVAGMEAARRAAAVMQAASTGATQPVPVPAYAAIPVAVAGPSQQVAVYSGTSRRSSESPRPGFARAGE